MWKNRVEISLKLRLIWEMWTFSELFFVLLSNISNVNHLFMVKNARNNASVRDTFGNPLPLGIYTWGTTASSLTMRWWVSVPAVHDFNVSRWITAPCSQRILSWALVRLVGGRLSSRYVTMLRSAVRAGVAMPCWRWRSRRPSSGTVDELQGAENA